MNLKDPFPAPLPRTARYHRRRGPKALFLEPLLILGASLLWLVVLPLAGILWSGNTLARRAHALG
jgi:hypothetical protein